MRKPNFVGILCVLEVLRVLLIGDTLLTAASPLRGIFASRHVKANPNASYNLSEQNGPWMIFAGSFAGEGSERDANALVLELRSRHKLPAYLHKKNYDYTKPVRGLGLNKYGEPKMMEYRQKGTFDEIAVLVGDYQSMHDPAVDQALKRIKYSEFECLKLTNDIPTTLRFAGLRALQKRANGNTAKRNKGPLGQAFVTRNPLIPVEFFAPRGINKFVESMNTGVSHSLLSCPGKYTVRVATFRGNVVIDQKKVKQIQESGHMKSRLVQAAERAHTLTEMLHKRGVEEAYQFHDIYESIVTVGSFESAGTPRQDGRIEINPAVLRIMQSYSPQQRQVGDHGMAGLVPRTLGGIPFDVQPTPVAVPKRSVAADYAVRGGSVR
jgi:hypothetical protein